MDVIKLAFFGVFNVDYFHTAAYLVRSPQLAKDTYILADFMRLVRPIFRAENSDTRHRMIKFTGIDIEMAIERSYLEEHSIIDGLLLQRDARNQRARLRLDRNRCLAHWHH